MGREPQFDGRSAARQSAGAAQALARGCALCALLLTLILAALCGGAAAYAQQASSGTLIGRIEGNDLSISAGSGGPVVGQNSGTISNGNTVTVHSGDARLMLTVGGEVDICGPAKLTLLQSGDAITLALDFGRARVQLPVSTNLRIFTPTIVATPIDINGVPRDVTLGLELDDSLCVHPASGALLLENQFSSEKLVVPLGGEFSLAQGKLVPVAGAPGSCECTLTEARVPTSPPLPSLGLTAPAQTATPTPQPAAAPNDKAQEAQPDVEFSVPAHANQTHPVNNSPKTVESVTPPPAEGTPNYKIVMPPLTFSANSPAPPPGPSADMVLLIRTVEVDPEWKFSGHVDPPPLNDAPRSRATEQPSQKSAQTSAPKKKSFWARVKRFFSGGG